MATIHRFEELECWQACRELRRFVARNLVPLLPADERFRLVDQILRSARSAPANIAEGFGRRHYLDNAKFIRNALGSLTETLDHAITACDEGMITEEHLNQVRSLFEKANSLTNGYASYLQREGQKK